MDVHEPCVCNKCEKTNFGHVYDGKIINANFKKSDFFPKKPKTRFGIYDLGWQDFSSGVDYFLTDSSNQYLSYKFEKNNFGHFCDGKIINAKSA